MSVNKKILCTLLIIGLLLSGCASKQVSIRWPVDHITHIELRCNQSPESYSLYTLEDEQVEPFVKSLLQLDCRKNFSAPLGEYGWLIIAIHYQNGDTEYLSDMAMGYFSEDGEEFDGWYYIPLDEMYDLCVKYIDDPQLLEYCLE